MTQKIDLVQYRAELVQYLAVYLASIMVQVTTKGKKADVSYGPKELIRETARVGEELFKDAVLEAFKNFEENKEKKD